MGPEVFALKERIGEDRITRGDLYEAAKNPLSPIHRHLEWDNEKCGEEYRLGQCGLIIGSLCRRFVLVGGEITYDGPIFVRVPGETKPTVHETGRLHQHGYYVGVDTIRREESQQEAMMKSGVAYVLGGWKRLEMMGEVLETRYKSGAALYAALKRFAEEVEGE